MSIKLGPRAQIEGFIKKLKNRRDFKREFNEVHDTIKHLLKVIKDPQQREKLQHLDDLIAQVCELMNKEDPTSIDSLQTRYAVLLESFHKIKDTIPEISPPPQS